MQKILYLLLLPIVLLMGCGKSQNQKDDDVLRKYISDNHLTAIAEPNGLYYVETQAGTGGNPVSTSTVYVNYQGYFANGVIFDETAGSPARFVLNQTITGWIEGIQLIKKGGKAKLLIPSLLAYGASGSGAVPANTPLIFDIELVNFQ